MRLRRSPSQFSTASASDGELEINDNETKTAVSGVQGSLSYNFIFYISDCGATDSCVGI